MAIRTRLWCSPMFGRIRRLHALSKRLIATSGGRNISRSICELSKFHGPILLWPLLKIRTVSRESRPGNVILSYPIEQNPTRWIKLLQKIEVSNIPRQYRTFMSSGRRVQQGIVKCSSSLLFFVPL